MTDTAEVVTLETELDQTVEQPVVAEPEEKAEEPAPKVSRPKLTRRHIFMPVQIAKRTMQVLVSIVQARWQFVAVPLLYLQIRKVYNAEKTGDVKWVIRLPYYWFHVVGSFKLTTPPMPKFYFDWYRIDLVTSHTIVVVGSILVVSLILQKFMGLHRLVWYMGNVARPFVDLMGQKQVKVEFQYLATIIRWLGYSFIANLPTCLLAILAAATWEASGAPHTLTHGSLLAGLFLLGTVACLILSFITSVGKANKLTVLRESVGFTREFPRKWFLVDRQPTDVQNNLDRITPAAPLWWYPWGTASRVSLVPVYVNWPVITYKVKPPSGRTLDQLRAILPQLTAALDDRVSKLSVTQDTRNSANGYLSVTFKRWDHLGAEYPDDSPDYSQIKRPVTDAEVREMLGDRYPEQTIEAKPKRDRRNGNNGYKKSVKVGPDGFAVPPSEEPEPEPESGSTEGLLDLVDSVEQLLAVAEAADKSFSSEKVHFATRWQRRILFGFKLLIWRVVLGQRTGFGLEDEQWLIPLGLTDMRSPLRYNPERSEHIVLVGAPGSGKTNSLNLFANGLTRLPYCMAAVDPTDTQFNDCADRMTMLATSMEQILLLFKMVLRLYLHRLAIMKVVGIKMWSIKYGPRFKLLLDELPQLTTDAADVVNLAFEKALEESGIDPKEAERIVKLRVTLVTTIMQLCRKAGIDVIAATQYLGREQLGTAAIGNSFQVRILLKPTNSAQLEAAVGEKVAGDPAYDLSRWETNRYAMIIGGGYSSYPPPVFVTHEAPSGEKLERDIQQAKELGFPLSWEELGVKADDLELAA